MSDFTQHYKTLSNYQLIKILDESEKYNPEAIETAKNELGSRKLNQDEVEQHKDIINSKKWENSKLNKNKKELEKLVAKASTSIAENLNPIQKGPVTIERYIFSIVLIFSGLTIYTFYEDYSFLEYLIFSGDMNWDYSVLEMILPVTLLPVATILFFLRKKIGWILLMIYSTNVIVSMVGMIILELYHEPSPFLGIESLFPSVNPISYIPPIIFFLAVSWVLFKKDLMSIFNTTIKVGLITISITLLIQGIGIFSMFYI